MGMGGRQPFPGTLSTIACPREPVCRYTALAQYVQPARQPSPNADGETGNHLFVLANPFQLGAHRFMLRASSIHTEAGIGKLLFGHCCPRPNTTPNTMPLQRLTAATKGPPTCSYIHADSRLSRAINLAVHQPPTRALGTALQNTRNARGLVL